MDLNALRQAVADGESDRLEFKKTTGNLKVGMRTLCAMLNGDDGRVLFGITPGGRIVGQDITDPTLQEVAQEVSGLEPPVEIEHTLVPVESVSRCQGSESDDEPLAPEAPFDFFAGLLAFLPRLLPSMAPKDPGSSLVEPEVGSCFAWGWSGLGLSFGSGALRARKCATIGTRDDTTKAPPSQSWPANPRAAPSAPRKSVASKA
jgi:hypothetical protein